MIQQVPSILAAQDWRQTNADSITAGPNYHNTETHPALSQDIPPLPTYVVRSHDPHAP